MRRFWRVGLGAAAIVIVATAVTLALLRSRSPDLVLTGLVDGNDVTVGAKIIGRLDRLAVREGDRVQAGDLLAVQEHLDLDAAVSAASAGVSQASASEQAARDQLDLVSASVAARLHEAQQQVQQTQAQCAQAVATRQQADTTYARVAVLLSAGAASAQDVDNARAVRDVAHAAVDACARSLGVMQAALRDAEAQQKQVATQRGQVAAARAATARSQAACDEAEAERDQTTIRAPVGGVVERLILRAGEVATPGSPILTLFDLSDTWVQADIEETYADSVALGQTVTVRLPSGRMLTGPIVYKAVEADFATQRDVSATKRDIKTVALRVRVANDDGRLVRGTTAYVILPRPR